MDDGGSARFYILLLSSRSPSLGIQWDSIHAWLDRPLPSFPSGSFWLSNLWNDTLANVVLQGWANKHPCLLSVEKVMHDQSLLAFVLKSCLVCLSLQSLRNCYKRQPLFVKVIHPIRLNEPDSLALCSRTDQSKHDFHQSSSSFPSRPVHPIDCPNRMVKGTNLI